MMTNIINIHGRKIEEQIENLSRKIEIIKQNGTARTKKCNILNKNVLEILSADQRWQKNEWTSRSIRINPKNEEKKEER